MEETDGRPAMHGTTERFDPSDDNDHSTSQSTTVSELVRQLRGHLGMDVTGEYFMDEIAPHGNDKDEDLDYFVRTGPSSTFDDEEGARDFETVSSISRMSAITDVVMLSDPELGAGRILSLQPPQPDEATIERPMEPRMRSFGSPAPHRSMPDGEMEPPVRSIVTMRTVKDNPNYDTIVFGDGVLKVSRQPGHKRQPSEQSTDDEDTQPSCSSHEIASTPRIDWRRVLTLFTLVCLFGATAAFAAIFFLRFDNGQEPGDDVPLSPPELPENTNRRRLQGR